MQQRSPMIDVVGRGLVAGLAGTAVMTAIQLIDQRITRRPPSLAPAEAAEKVLHVEPRTERSESLLNHAVHWTYGSAWGLARAWLPQLGLRGPLANLAHMGAVWGTSLVLLPAMGLAPPITRWSRKEILKDLLYHGAYAATTGMVYRRLAPRPRPKLLRRVARRSSEVWQPIADRWQPLADRWHPLAERLRRMAR